jgi:hypothetical protein
MSETKPLKSFAKLITKEDYDKLSDDEITDFNVKNEINKLAKIPEYINITFYENVKCKGDIKSRQNVENMLPKLEDLIDENGISEKQHIEDYILELKNSNSDESIKEKLYLEKYLHEHTKVQWDFFTHTNPELVEEIFQAFLLVKDNKEFSQSIIDNIKLQLLTAIDNEAKKEIIINSYNEYSNDFNCIEIIKSYFVFFNNLNTDSEEFYSFIKTLISLDKEVKIDFLTEGCDMNFFEHDIFKDWSELESINKVIRFLRDCQNEQKINLDNSQSIKNVSALTLNQSLLLLDDILNMKPEEWNYIDRTKKARLISRLLKSNYSNTLKGLTLLEKKGSETSIKFKEDQIFIKNLIKDTLHNT